MQIKFLEQRIDYDGSQLSPHWIYKTCQLLGDALVAFRGGCNVPLEKMVDQVDVRENKPIFSEEMLHFIGEFFETPLTQTILLERLLVSLAQQEIVIRAHRPEIIRGGNDLYDGEAKLSVAIATSSPVSTLLHFGINIVSRGTPVKTRGLNDYGIEVEPLAKALLETFRDEVATLKVARSKVRPVY